MKYGCPNKTCVSYRKTHSIVKNGSFRRKSDSRTIPRYKCKKCNKKFSSATFSLAYGQNKRRLNNPVFKLLSSGVSIRRSAKILGVNQKTVARKLKFLGKKCALENQKRRKELKRRKVSKIQFDDLITIEHTKLKPVSVTLAVDSISREILGFRVSRIPAFGHLAELSRKKYGKRKSELRKGIDELFSEIKSCVDPYAIINSDEHPFYKLAVSKHFPKASYEQFKSERGCVAGQGELKKVKFDPIFSINHTLAMLRANINRLIRRSWCTTKKVERLVDHLEIYVNYHNRFT